MRRLIVPSVMAVVGHGAAFALLRSGTSSSGRTRSSPPAGLLAGRTLPEPSVFATEQARVRVVTMTDGLVEPWALAFLSNGDMLITERAGRLRLMHDGRLASANIGGIPPVDTRTQDGLMDLALHPRFAQNQILYFTYSKLQRDDHLQGHRTRRHGSTGRPLDAVDLAVRPDHLLRRSVPGMARQRVSRRALGSRSAAARVAERPCDAPGGTPTPRPRPPTDP